MKLTCQYRTNPIRWDERPKNKGEEIVINKNITFGEAIKYIEDVCNKYENFHHYDVHILKQTYKYPIRISFNIYLLDPNRKLKGECGVKSWEDKIPPYIDCIYTLYNNDNCDDWCEYGQFNVVNIN